MARVAGVDIPDAKRVNVALTYILGIGNTVAGKILDKVGITGGVFPKVKDLSEEELNKIREIVEKEYIVEGDLRRETTMNIRRLIDIGTYRGLRHRFKLPVKGQRTKTNARTRKGVKKTVAGRGRRSGMQK